MAGAGEPAKWPQYAENLSNSGLQGAPHGQGPIVMAPSLPSISGAANDEPEVAHGPDGMPLEMAAAHESSVVVVLGEGVDEVEAAEAADTGPQMVVPAATRSRWQGRESVVMPPTLPSIGSLDRIVGDDDDAN